MRLFKPFLQPFKALVFVGVFGLASVSASACDWSFGAKESGSGNIESEARNVSRFTGVSLSLPARAEIVQCGSEGISVAGTGDVAYYGDAGVTQSVAGSGSVKRLGNAPARS